MSGELPHELSANAWDGERVVRATVSADRARTFALGASPAGRLMRPRPIDDGDWTDPRVGWGLVLPDDPDVPVAQRGRADDAPEPIRELVASRPGARVMRWRSALGPMALADYASGAEAPVPIGASRPGVAELPRYLLLYGGPDVLPWWLQSVLNADNYVGRLDLDGEALENYVSALLAGWRDSGARYDRPVVWATGHGGGDMTEIMRTTIAAPLIAKLRGDDELGGLHVLEAGAATADALCSALSEQTPALVVTTSHGQTGPLGDPVAMRSKLGALVDQQHALVEPARLLGDWQPDGAIWYAHACCSAGGEAPSAFAELFEPGSGLRALLEGVASLGPSVAPLPRALLGAKHPLRAFIGHVEPTFEWTIRFPFSGQAVTDSIVSALYQGLCGGEGAGYAMRHVWRPIGQLGVAMEKARQLLPKPQQLHGALTSLLYLQVVWRDRGSTVVLGDPTAALPLP